MRRYLIRAFKFSGMVRAWSTAIAFVLLIHIYTSLQFPATSKVTRNVTRFKRKITTQPDGRIFNYILNDNAQNDESISKNLHTSERKGFYGTTQQTEVLAKTQEDASHTGAMTKTIHTRNKRIKKRDTETHMTPEGGNSSFIETENSGGKTGRTTAKQGTSTSNAQESNGTLERTLSNAPKTSNTEANGSATTNIPRSEMTLTNLRRTSQTAGITERTTVVSATNEANFSLSTSNNEPRNFDLIDNITMPEPSVSMSDGKKNNGTHAEKIIDISVTTLTTLTTNTSVSNTQEKTGSTPSNIHSTLLFDQNSNNGTDGNKSASTELNQNANVSKSSTITTEINSSLTKGGNNSATETENSGGKNGGTTVKPGTSTSNTQERNDTLDGTLSNASKTSNTEANGSATTNIPKSESNLTILHRTSRNAEITDGTTVVSTTNKANFSLSTSNNETKISHLFDNITKTEASVSMSIGKENNSTPAAKMVDTSVTTFTTLSTDTSVSDTKEKTGSTPSSLNLTPQLDQNSINGTDKNRSLSKLNEIENVSKSLTITTEINSFLTKGGHNSAIETENSGGRNGGTTVKPRTSTSNTQESNGTLERTLSSASKMSNTEANGSATTNIPGSESTLTILHRTSRNAEITDGTTVVSTTNIANVSLSTSNNETSTSSLIHNITMPEPSVSMSNGKENNSIPASKMNDISVTYLTTLTTNTILSNTQEKTGNTSSNIHSTHQFDQNSINGTDRNSSVTEELIQNENVSKSSTITSEINVSSTEYDADNLITGAKTTNTAQVSNTSIPTQNVTKRESSSTTSGDIVTSNSDDDISKAMGTEIPITTNLFNTDQSFHTYSESSANTEQNVTNTDNTIDTETTTDIAEAETESVATTSEIIPTMEESTTHTNKEIQTTTVTNPTAQWTTEIDCAMQQGNVTLTNFESNSTYFKIYFESSFNPDCVDEYIVEYQENNKAQLEQTIATNKTFETSGLSPCTRYRTKLIISTTPNTQYTITVAAIAKVGTGLFYNPPMSKTTSPAAAGPVLNINVNILPSEPNSDSASIDASWEMTCKQLELRWSIILKQMPPMIPNENIDPSSQAVVLIKNTIFTEDTGRIMKLSLVVSTKNVTQTFGKLPAPTLESWSQTKAGEKNMYQATNDDWMPFQMMMPNGRVETQYAFYTLGNDHNCKPESEQFCNGPLNPDSEYTVLLRAQTAAGYRDLSKIPQLQAHDHTRLCFRFHSRDCGQLCSHCDEASATRLHDVTVIVMVTNLTEKGKDKCHQYYPNLRETKDFCFISVKCTTEINFPVYTSRTLLVQKHKKLDVFGTVLKMRHQRINMVQTENEQLWYMQLKARICHMSIPQNELT
ncbi:hypothetical protein B566_EDAN011820 [Ephemera danica]|nr:hypothetical protein B566_EDAN011820 [Ephemera danica]